MTGERGHSVSRRRERPAALAPQRRSAVAPPARSPASATSTDAILQLQALAGNRAVDDLIQNVGVEQYQAAGRQAPSRRNAPIVVAQRAVEAAHKSVKEMTSGERLIAAIELAPIGGAVKEKIREALNPEALAIAVGAIVAIQLIPVAWVAELAGVALAAAFLGWALYRAIRSLVEFAEARNAQTDEDLRKAGRAFADAVAEIGVDAILVLLTHRISKAVKAQKAEPPPPTTRVALVTAGDGSVVPVIADTIPPKVAGELGLRNEALPGARPGRPAPGEAPAERPAAAEGTADGTIALDEEEAATLASGRKTLAGLRERARSDPEAAQELVLRYDLMKDRALWKMADEGDETAAAILRQRIEEVLRELSPADADAGLQLVRRYSRMTDSALWKLAGKGDQTATALLRQRAATELRRARLTSRRPPHSAGAVYRDADGKIVDTVELDSGSMTQAEKDLGTVNAGHTESRAVRSDKLVRGGSLWITGQYDPCPACQAEMRAAAKRTGALINYWWPGGPRGGMWFRP
jgi:hypothetical protein